MSSDAGSPHSANELDIVLKQVTSYYASKLVAFGATSGGVDWNGTVSHELRHRQFLRLLDGNRGASILDLGCGYGDFCRFLRAEGYHGLFTGYDVVPGMIAEASRLHGEAGCRWRVGDNPSEPADFAVASGIFNVRGGVAPSMWTEYVHRTIDVLAGASTLGFAFNILSLSSDPNRRAAHLHYADAAEMLSHCLRRYGRSVALLQDYGLFEFTVIVRHDRAG
ncbi:class I SAM-dependent methyltransferase [Bradyrhizobium xenonodulans]|uniref:Class I SAM-dependent methyltransferase n=1 Tax=Bradyrhizobium xenonodulans TaxID=2736875 RepID=A0ABY7MFX5_9BRAD|nr:class I SAM-dependent methyltransferase [Bradyrhizobium xenonodulans]WBL76496.1 class I SAM-dependent methyltransferase [Bradyrhizobium xenonodulans]